MNNFKDGDIVVVEGYYPLSPRYTEVGRMYETQHHNRYYPIGMISSLVDPGDKFGLRIIGNQGGFRSISKDIIVRKATEKEKFLYYIYGTPVITMGVVKRQICQKEEVAK